MNTFLKQCIALALFTLSNSLSPPQTYAQPTTQQRRPRKDKRKARLDDPSLQRFLRDTSRKTVLSWYKEQRLLKELVKQTPSTWLLPILVRSRRHYPGPLDEIERRRLSLLGQYCAQIGTSAHPFLRKGLQHPWWTVREATLHVLRSMGAKASKSLRKDLEARLLDDHYQVRRVALYTLRKFFGAQLQRPTASWSISLSLLGVFLGTIWLGYILLQRWGWSSKRIFHNALSISTSAWLVILLGFFLGWWMEEDLQALSTYSIYDDSRVLPFAMRLLWLACILFAALWALRKSEQRNAYKPHLIDLFRGLLGMAVFVVFLGPIASLLGHQRLPIPQVFAMFGFFAALSSMLIGYAAFSPQKH